MDRGEQLRQALEAVAAHPRRVIASALGVFWGAAAIVVLLGWGSGFRTFMHAELGRFGRGAVFLSPAVTSSGFPDVAPGREVELSREDLEAAERDNREWIEALLPHHVSDGRVLVEAPGGRVRRLDLSASDHRFLHYRSFVIAHGRGFDAREAARGDAVAVLGPEAAEELFPSAAVAVGQTVRVAGRPFRIVGVPEAKGRQYFNTHRPDNRLLVVPAAAAEKRLGFSEDDVASALLFPRPRVEPEQAVRAAFRTLGPRARFHPEDDDAVKSFDSTFFMGLVDLFHAGFLVFIGVAGTITLLIGGIGIANYHLATLAERTVEIGIEKALGARDRTLVARTVLESLLVSGAAAGGGVALGAGACAAFARWAPVGVLPIPELSAVSLAITFAALLGVAVVAAAIPALRVRRIEIASALRAST